MTTHSTAAAASQAAGDPANQAAELPALSASEVELLDKTTAAIEYVSSPEIRNHAEGLGIGAFAGALLIFAVWKSFRYSRPNSPKNQ